MKPVGIVGRAVQVIFSAVYHPTKEEASPYPSAAASLFQRSDLNLVPDRRGVFYLSLRETCSDWIINPTEEH